MYLDGYINDYSLAIGAKSIGLWVFNICNKSFYNGLRYTIKFTLFESVHFNNC